MDRSAVGHCHEYYTCHLGSGWAVIVAVGRDKHDVDDATLTIRAIAPKHPLLLSCRCGGSSSHHYRPSPSSWRPNAAAVVVAEDGGGAVPEVRGGRTFRVVAGTAAAAAAKKNTEDHRAAPGAAVRLDWSSPYVVDGVVAVVVVVAGLVLPAAPAAVRLDLAAAAVVDRPVFALLRAAPVSSFLLVVEWELPRPMASRLLHSAPVSSFLSVMEWATPPRSMKALACHFVSASSSSPLCRCGAEFEEEPLWWDDRQHQAVAESSSSFDCHYRLQRPELTTAVAVPAFLLAEAEEEGDEPWSFSSHWWRLEEEKSSLCRRLGAAAIVVVVVVVVGCHSATAAWAAAPANSSSSAGTIQRPPGEEAGVGRMMRSA
jgi:hypothetical protein